MTTPFAPPQRTGRRHGTPWAVAIWLLASTVLVPSPGRAWRETGHFAVCEIAYRHLSDAARARVDEILGGQPFAPQCTWPDMIRKSAAFSHTYSWHFINLDGDDYFEPGTLNPEGDVLQALLDAERTLAAADATADARKMALRFLGHLAGDSHQPLHVGHKSDQGGNLIRVRWFGDETFESVTILKRENGGEACEGEGVYFDEPTGECAVRLVERAPVNLHKVWDLLMVQKFIAKKRLRPEPGDSEFLHRAYATAVAGLLSAEEIAALRGSTFWDWIADSLARRDQAYDVGRGRLGRRYYRRHVDDLNRQIARAGYRLAFTLDRLFGDPPPEAAAIEARHEELRRRIAELLAAQ